MDLAQIWKWHLKIQTNFKHFKYGQVFVDGVCRN